MRELYENLVQDPESDIAQQNPLLAAIAREARLHRAAQALADDEFMEGLWVDEDEIPVEQIRLAAEDDTLVQSARYERGPHAVFVVSDEADHWVATHVKGPAGASLRFGADYVVLEPGQDSELPAVKSLPDHLILVDENGREWRLERVNA